MSITIIGFAMIAAAVWAWFTPDNPEQADTTPDNVPMSQDQMEAYRAESETYISTWTYGKLIRTRPDQLRAGTIYDDYRRCYESVGTSVNGPWLCSETQTGRCPW